MKQYTTPTAPPSVWKKPSHFIAFGFGVGTIPFAPGTFGTLIAIPFYLILESLSILPYCLIVIAIMLASSWLCDRVSNEINVRDHQGMCLDEIVGFLVTMIAAPSGWLWIGLGFLLFRFFDIVKPWPISWLDQHVHGGFGMIFDDVAAGIASCVILQIVYHLLK